RSRVEFRHRERRRTQEGRERYRLAEGQGGSRASQTRLGCGHARREEAGKDAPSETRRGVPTSRSSAVYWRGHSVLRRTAKSLGIRKRTAHAAARCRAVFAASRWKFRACTPDYGAEF